MGKHIVVKLNDSEAYVAGRLAIEQGQSTTAFIRSVIDRALCDGANGLGLSVPGVNVPAPPDPSTYPAEAAAQPEVDLATGFAYAGQEQGDPRTEPAE